MYWIWLGGWDTRSRKSYYAQMKTNSYNGLGLLKSNVLIWPNITKISCIPDAVSLNTDHEIKIFNCLLYIFACSVAMQRQGVATGYVAYACDWNTLQQRRRITTGSVCGILFVQLLRPPIFSIQWKTKLFVIKIISISQFGFLQFLPCIYFSSLATPQSLISQYSN